MSSDVEIDFSGILASSVHDMKNSLGLVINSLDELVEEIGDSSNSEKMSKLQYEAKRVNNNLIQLLSLYKIGNTGLKANIDEYSVHEFIEDGVLQEKPVLDSMAIQVTNACSQELWWYFDRDLITGVLSNAINNAIRYTDGQLLVDAVREENYLVIHVNDNGVGYPDSMLQSGEREGHGVSFETGNTGLGIFFSAMVAKLHKNKGKQGYIELSNGYQLGGGCFSIYLP